MSIKEKLSSPGTPQNMDDIITGLGMGPWNCLYFMVSALELMTLPVSLIGAEFMAPLIDFSCTNQARNYSLGSNECFVRPPDTNSTTPAMVPCDSFVYDNSTYVSTLTAEFDMVCSRERLRGLFQMLFTLGCIVGCPLGGILSDRYGRQKNVFYGTLLSSMTVIVMTTVPSLPVVMVARFFLGFFYKIFDNASYTIGMEACPIKYRSIFGVMVALPFATMVTALAGIAWLSRRWRVVQLAGSVPLFLMVIICNPYVLMKSPRWLVSQGRLQEAEKGLRWAASLNNTTHSLPDDLPGTLRIIHAKQNNSKGGEEPLPENESLRTGLRSLIVHPRMRHVTLVVALIWLFQSSLYLSIPLRADIFESPFIFVALLGVAEIPAYMLTGPITDKVGRRPFIIGCFLLTAAVEMTLMVLVLVGMEAAWTSILIASFGYTFICSAFQVNLMYCSEVFPTTVRSLGTSVAFFMGSIGYNLPPLLDVILPKDIPWLPLLIYCSLGCICAGLVLLLPETNRRPLMQSVQEHINYTQENNEKLNPSTTHKK